MSFARNVCIQLPIKIIQGAKTVEAMQSYAAPLIGPMMQAYGMPQAPGIGALGPETTQEHVTSYNINIVCKIILLYVSLQETRLPLN